MDLIPPRSFNTIHVENDCIIKTSQSSDFDGELYWYRNIPKDVKYLFPKYSIDNNKLILQKIHCKTFSTLYASEELTTDHLVQCLQLLTNIHCSQKLNKSINIYENYCNKLKKRYFSYDYSRFPDSDITYSEIYNYLKNYEEYNKGIPSVIHGDPVFTNILLENHTNDLKFIDMRGKLGKVLSIFGDSLYDFAKLYQSIIGYDHIMHEKAPNDNYISSMKDAFFNYVCCNLGNERVCDIKMITKSLLFTLIPLHNNDKCSLYYDLISHA